MSQPREVADELPPTAASLATNRGLPGQLATDLGRRCFATPSAPPAGPNAEHEGPAAGPV